jgi:rhodanese-related sulfurtransferase
VRTFRELAPAEAFPCRFRIIDVREPDEFTGELGHIPGAELVPLATVLERAHEWSRDDELLVVCRSGGRSSRAAEALVRAGFRHVINLVGGMIAYRAAGLPAVCS